jgi:hypothetical protein
MTIGGISNAYEIIPQLAIAQRSVEIGMRLIEMQAESQATISSIITQMASASSAYNSSGQVSTSGSPVGRNIDLRI